MNYIKFFTAFIPFIFTLLSEIYPQKYANNWHFGNYAGITFNSGSPVAISNSSMVAWGGCSSISDTAGNLICYTNGSTVYNKLNNVMQNGSGLMGDFMYGNYGPSVIIIPRPGSTTTYYIFSINRNNSDPSYPDALRYTTVISTLNNGEGGVINRNTIIMQKTFDAKITAVKHANGNDYWVIVHESNTNKFYAFLVSNAGVNTTPVVSQTGRTVLFPYNYYWWNGYLKASPDGKKIASSYHHIYSYTYNDSANCEIFDFNNSTGVLSNPIELTISKWGYYYYWGANSIEFSPDGSKIYLVDHSNYWPSSLFELYQYDLRAGNSQDIQKSRTKIATVSGMWYWWYSGGMQLGIDGKIYVARYNSSYLGVINAPEQKGIGCCYQDSAIYLGINRITYNGLPQFVTSWFFKHPFEFKNTCYGNETVFTITNTSCLDSVLWDFGDTNSGSNNYSTSLTGKHIFTSPGKYNVSLTTYRMGTANTSFHEVEIFPLPDKQLYINDTFQCLKGNYFRFIDSTTITNDSIINRKWMIGDDLFFQGNITDTSHVFTTCDTWPVKIIYVTKHGCFDSLQRKVWINPEPKAKFNLNDSVQCLNENKFIFTNESSIQYGSLSYYWNFGDTCTATDKSPVHVYSQPDTFTVRLITVSDAGCSDTFSKFSYVHPSPKTFFSVNNSSQCLNGNIFIFKDSSTIQHDVLKYFWDFGDGNNYYAKDTSHSYQADDTFTVRLVTISSLGCPDTFAKKVFVHPNPVSAFQINRSGQCLFQNLFSFTNNSVIKSGTYSSNWYFGDNTLSTATNPQHSYTKEGSYTIKLVNTSWLGCSDSSFANVSVFPMPSASFTINDSIQCFNEQHFTFNNSSVISNDTINRLIWIINPDTIFNQVTLSYRNFQPGTHFIRLIAISSQACSDTSDRMVIVSPSPEAKFSVNDTVQCFKWHEFKFLNQSGVSSGSLNYYWDFGDGNTETDISPVHHYTSADTFTIKLITVTDKGCTDTSESQAILHPSPEISVGINDTNQCFSGNHFIFYNHTKIKWGKLNFRWYFGDGDSSMLVNPSHSYNYPDTFAVMMIAETATGCSDSFAISTIVKVQPMPQALFSIDDSSQCKNTNLLKFNNLSSITNGSITSYWDFGDNTYSTMQHPVHHYQTEDTFEIKLITISNWDCRDSFIRKAVIFPVPIVSFITDQPQQCLLNNNFVFTNQSSINTGSIIGNNWYSGDGSHANTVHFTHSYSKADTFNVRLISESDQHCFDTTEMQTIVFPMPYADFSVDSAEQCLKGNLFKFADKSSISKGYVKKWLWDMGDGTTFNVQNPVHTYLSHQQYNVKLTVESDQGCRDSIIKNTKVYPMPECRFLVNDTDQCSNKNHFVFTNQSVVSEGILSFLWQINNTPQSVQKDFDFVFLNEGIQTVKLVAISNFGCADSSERIVWVLPSPVVSFSVNDTHQCLKGNRFVFNNLSSISSGTLTHYWNFGDGTTDVSTSAVHSYSADSSYAVKLKSISGLNCSDSSFLVVVVHPMPTADFGYSQPCLDKVLYFKDLSTISPPDLITKWDWDLADGTSSQRDPLFTFTKPGLKDIKLTVTSNFECRDDTSMQISIEEHVKAPYLLTATVNNNHEIYLEWEKPKTGIPLFYNIEKSVNGSGFLPYAKLDASTYSYYDLQTDASENIYTYRINAEDTCSYTGAYSNSGQNILLTVNDSDAFPVISWTSYYDWPEGVREYVLELSDNEMQNFEPIASFLRPVSHTDNVTDKDQEYYCYRITAYHQTRPDVESKSNIVCIPTILYAFVPNAFTPNSDGLNDTFLIKGKNIHSFNLKIFNKWGEEIYSSTDINDGWDGTYNSIPCPVDTYYFHLKLTGSNGQQKSVSGTLNLIR